MSRLFRRILKKRFIKNSLIFTGIASTGVFLYNKWPLASIFDNIPTQNNVGLYADQKPIDSTEIPTRLTNLQRLKSGEEFDVLVIGGGCTGSGIALDAANRGLNVAMVEKGDYSSGTSSRSTKLIHGGVRYLEKAFKNLDYKQLSLVFEALAERKHLLSVSPNLSYEIPLIVPLYYGFPEIYFYIPYFWSGMKLYDIMSGTKGRLKPSRYMSKKEVTEKFPMLNDKGLKGAIVYYDGMHNDARMNISIALTASHKGAAVANHVEVLKILKDEMGKANGALLVDKITGDEFEVRSKTVVNATGCFSDRVRKMDNQIAKEIVVPSGGVHVVLPSEYCPKDMGMLVPNTDDGRVLFFLPWEGSTLAGTTDTSCEVKEQPKPTKEEVSFIMKELKKYLRSDLTVEDVNASWSGIRPLAKDLKSKNTSAISRNHEIEVSDSGMISITGGKWTTYRRMSEEVVNVLLQMNPTLRDKSLRKSTKQVPLVGASGWSLSVKNELLTKGFPEDVAEHLSHNYGYLAYEVADLGLKNGLDKNLAKGYPFIEAEVLFGIRNEHAVHAVDVIARRIRLAFLNSQVAKECLPRVLEIMANEKKWDSEKRVDEFWNTILFLDTMNVQDKKRHTWGSTKSAELTAQKIAQAFGECPLANEDIQNLLNLPQNKNNQIYSGDYVETLEKMTITKSAIRKHLPTIEKFLEQGQHKNRNVEDLIFLTCGAIIKNKE